ncbi:MAG: glycosyltransferase family 77 protein [Alphaproteobacteria bacterium]|nr:glycosyltransferase family 77 protein [Alphaproteobacteria bacterium]
MIFPDLSGNSNFECYGQIAGLPEEVTWLGGGQRFVACVFYTDNYTCQVKRLKESLEILGINHHLKLLPRRTTWEATTRLKAGFVADCLDKFSDFDVLYLDADAVVREPPDFFESVAGDVGVLFTPTFRKGRPCLTIAAGTLYVRNTPGGRRFAEAWRAQEANVGVLGLDEDMIYAAFEDFAGVSFTALPRSYSKIFDAEGPKPVIEHFQASRGQFKLSKLARRGKRFVPIFGVAGAAVIGLMYLAKFFAA